MKFFQAFVAALVGGFVLSLAVGAHAQSDSKPGYATIVRIQGEARYSPDGDMSHAHPLTVGQTLGPGSVIQTAANSMVDIVLGDKINDHLVPVPDQVALAYDASVRDMISYKAVAEQNVIRLEADTVLAIDKLLIANTGVDAVSDTELDLRQGTIFGNVKKLSAASQYVIKTPNGIAGIRGTTFMMSANGDITVISGSMVASHVGPNGQITTVVFGPGDTIRSGHRPGHPPHTAAIASSGTNRRLYRDLGTGHHFVREGIKPSFTSRPLMAMAVVSGHGRRWWRHLNRRL